MAIENDSRKLSSDALVLMKSDVFRNPYLSKGKRCLESCVGVDSFRVSDVTRLWHLILDYISENGLIVS